MMLESQTPNPSDSRAIRIREFRRTVEKVAPVIDQTRVLSPEEVAQLKAEHVLRQADKSCAAREGRAGVRERFHRAVGRVTGDTPVAGEPVQKRAVEEDRDPLEGTDEPDDGD